MGASPSIFATAAPGAIISPFFRPRQMGGFKSSPSPLSLSLHLSHSPPPPSFKFQGAVVGPLASRRRFAFDSSLRPLFSLSPLPPSAKHPFCTALDRAHFIPFPSFYALTTISLSSEL